MCAGRLGYDQESTAELAGELVEELSSSGQMSAAALILAEYLKDVDNAVSMLTAARWALDLVARRGVWGIL